MKDEGPKGEEVESIDPSKFMKFLINFIKSDLLAIILFILAISACIYTISTADQYQQECNDYYTNFIKENCVCTVTNVKVFDNNLTLPLTLIEVPV